MWLKKLCRRKLQFFLIGLVLLVAAALLNLCLCFSAELSAFSDRSINRANCPDAYLLSVGTQYFDEHFTDPQRSNEVESVTALSGKTVTAPIQYNGKDITQLYDMALSFDNYRAFHYLELREGSGESTERNGVWLSETLASPNHIQLGDTITLRYDTPVDLTVTGIYRSSCFPKAVGFSPMLMSGETIAALEENTPAALFAVNVSDYSSTKVKTLFEDSDYNAVTRTRDDVRASLMEYSGSIGVIGAMAAFVIFIVALVILRFLVRSSLLREYHTIGIYKSLGLPSRKISAIYRNGYLLVGAVSITLGAFSALFLVELIGRYCTEYVDGFQVGSTSLLVSCVAILLFVGILWLNLILALRRIWHITPVEAITIGKTKLEQRLPPPMIQSAKSSFAVAVNELVKYKKSTFLLLLTISASVFLSLFFGMIWTSSDQMIENANLWFSLPVSDAYIAGDISDNLKSYLAENGYVKSAVYGDFGNDQLKVEGYPQQISYIRFDTYSTFDPAVTGVRMTGGRGPEAAGEVAVGEKLLRALDLWVGDSIALTLHGTTKDYIVTGSYTTIAEGGQKAMLTTDAVQSCTDYKSSRAFIRLHHRADYEAFKQEVEDHFGGVAVDTGWFAMENSVESIRGMLKSVSMVLIAAFMLFSILNCVIVLFMEHRSGRKKFGILKALGFSNGSIIRQNLSKYLLLSLAGVALALGVHLLLSQRLGAAMLIDAFVNSNLMLALLAAGFVILILSTVFLISLSIRKITPVELMEE